MHMPDEPTTEKEVLDIPEWRDGSDETKASRVRPMVVESLAMILAKPLPYLFEASLD